MNTINLQITSTDGTETTVTAVAADLIAFEARFDLSIVKLQSEIRLTHMFFLAWHVLKRTNKTNEEFEKWAEGVAAVTEASEKK
jgi:hypothetical protein